MPGLAPARRRCCAEVSCLPEWNACSVFLDLALPGPVSLLPTLVIVCPLALVAADSGAHLPSS